MKLSHFEAMTLLHSVIEDLESGLQRYREKDYATQFFIDVSIQRITELKEVEETFKSFDLSTSLSSIEAKMKSMMLEDEFITSFQIVIHLKQSLDNHRAFIETNQLCNE